MNYVTEAKNLYLKGIDENKYIDEADKPAIKALVSRQCQIIAQYIGNLELLTLRMRMHPYNNQNTLTHAK